MREITSEELKNFRNLYRENPENKRIENAITKNGIQAVCLNREAVLRAKNVFNIEIPTHKIYDQTGSCRCWCHAGINMIKNDVAKNLNIKPEELDLSINYIVFFDKLEKSNQAYENVIELENMDFQYINKEHILTFSVDEGGWFEYFRSIILKYGLVPSDVMPETVNSTDSDILTNLLTEKVKKDALKLIKMKKENKSIQEIEQIKTKMLQENYSLLCKVLGEPPEEFDFEYRDQDNKYVRLENMTPAKFRDQYLSIALEEYISICHEPRYDKPFYHKFRKKYLGNVIDNSFIEFINLPIEEIKELIIKQLLDNVPVWFATEVKKMRDRKEGIMDSHLYDYENVLGIEMLTKEENLNLNDITLQHAMVFTGVNLKDNCPERWKVEDSYGEKIHKNGFYVMNDSFFEDFVMEVIINKKYLSEQQLAILKQEPILVDIDEPI